MKFIIGISMLLVLLIACAQEQPSAPVRPPAEDEAPVVPETQKEEETAPPETNVLNTEAETALDVNSVQCDPAERKITFAFQNNDVKNWQMNQEVPFPAPSDLAAVRVYLNSYEVNGRNPYILNGETMFGPEERFSDNCGGVELLAPGEIATCTLQPVPLKAANQLTAGKNEILVHSPTSKHIIQFTCE